MAVTPSEMAYLVLLGQGYDTVFSGRCETIFFYQHSESVLSPTVLRAPGALPAIARRRERDANSFPPLDADVKNEWSCTALLSSLIQNASYRSPLPDVSNFYVVLLKVQYLKQNVK